VVRAAGAITGPTLVLAEFERRSKFDLNNGLLQHFAQRETTPPPLNLTPIFHPLKVTLEQVRVVLFSPLLKPI